MQLRLEPDGFFSGLEQIPLSDVGDLLEEPHYVVLQASGQTGRAAALEHFRGGGKRAVHFIVDEGGTVVQCLSLHLSSRHLGASAWGWTSDLSRHTIGICLVNSGKLYQVGTQYKTWYGKVIKKDDVYLDDNDVPWQAFPEEQIRALVSLTDVLLSQRTVQAILGLSDVSPAHPDNPGAAFPMTAFRHAMQGLVEEESQGFGYQVCRLTPIFSEPSDDDLQVAPPLSPGTHVTLEALWPGGWAQVSTQPGEPFEIAVCGWVRRRAIALADYPAPDAPAPVDFDDTFDFDDLKNADYSDDEEDDD